jgi:hypothetical protein
MPRPVSNNVRDFVLPVCNLGHNEDGNIITDGAELVGTCFLIGDRGYALTAAHVLRQVQNDIARVLVPNSEGWDACLIRRGEPHPTEDVGLLKIDLPRPITSPVLFAADLPLHFHPKAIRASASFKPWGAGGATCDRRSWSGLRRRSHVAERLAA